MLRTPTIPQSLRRTCRDVLATAAAGKPGDVVGLISASPGEGVSTIAVGLTRILSESSRVLLIDASAGRPVSRLIDAAHRPLGAEELSHLHLIDLDDWIIPCPGLNLELLTLEKDQLSAASWDRRWAALKLLLMQRYQLFVIDLGSLHTQLSPFWSACLDHAYVIVDVSRTTVDALQDARKEFDVLRLPLAGAILNRRSFAVPAFLGGDRP